MSKSADNDSPPLIFKETTKLLQSMETNDEELYKSKSLLSHKQTYYEQLQQHLNRQNKSIAEKRAALAIMNDRSSLINTKNALFREKGQEICTSCNAAHQDINESEVAFSEWEDKVDDMIKSADQNNTQYEKKIDELIKLLNQLTEKSKKKLDAVELQEKKLREEVLDMHSQSAMCQKEEDLIGDENDESDVGDLENELNSLQNKLSILNEDYASITKEDELNEVLKGEVEKTYHESIYRELETKSAEVTKEIETLLENVDKQKATQKETCAFYHTLEEYEGKLNEDLTQTAKFWEDLEQKQCDGISKLEQEIGKIREDIIIRNERYGSAQDQKSKLTESLQKRDGEIEKLNSTFDQIAAELKEVENFLEALNFTDDLSEHYNSMLNKMNDLHKERISAEEISSQKENEIQEINNQLQKNREKRDLEILTLENNNLMEVKELDKQYADIEAAKLKLEKDVRSSEDRIKELEEAKATRKEKSEELTKNLKELDTIIEESQKNLKIITMKRDETRKKLANFAAPPPIYVRKNEVSENFIKPKLSELPKTSKKSSSPKEKRKWDSDSSIEEEVNLSDFLKKKHRRQQLGK